MSTIQGLSIEAQDEARRRAMDEVYRRQQERLELKRELVEALRHVHSTQRTQTDLQADLDELHRADGVTGLREVVGDAHADRRVARVARPWITGGGAAGAPQGARGLGRAGLRGLARRPVDRLSGRSQRRGGPLADAQ